MKSVYCTICFITLLLTNLRAQKNDPAWDNTVSKTWPSPFEKIQLISGVDKSVQQAWYYQSTKAEAQPLIVSLHTWSGDYMQEDPLAREALLRNWNYIHPDFRGANNRPDACGSPLVIADIEDAIRYAVRRGHTDSTNVHIIGVSGGGYAALLCYMKLMYPVKSFSAWVPISDLRSWYWESKGRNARYATDIEQVAMHKRVMDWSELDRRSPLHLTVPVKRRKNIPLHLFAGIHDGYTGSVPISHSLLFYNKVVTALFPSSPELLIPEKVIRSLLAQRLNPGADSNNRLQNRLIQLEKKAGPVRLTLFEGGHEMLAPVALSLLPADTQKHTSRLKVVCIGDSNGAAENGWPQQLGKLMPYSSLVNISISGNTIGFNNLEQPRLNTLGNINQYLDSAFSKTGSNPDLLLIGLGTNDAKAVFAGKQDSVRQNLSKLIRSVKDYCIRHQKKIPRICVISPPPADNTKADPVKYGGAGERIIANNIHFRNICNEQQIDFLDIHTALLAGLENRTTDGIHLTETTQFEVAVRLIRYINTYFKK